MKVDKFDQVNRPDRLDILCSSLSIYLIRQIVHAQLVKCIFELDIERPSVASYPQCTIFISQASRTMYVVHRLIQLLLCESTTNTLAHLAAPSISIPQRHLSPNQTPDLFILEPRSLVRLPTLCSFEVLAGAHRRHGMSVRLAVQTASAYNSSTGPHD